MHPDAPACTQMLHRKAVRKTNPPQLFLSQASACTGFTAGARAVERHSVTEARQMGNETSPVQNEPTYEPSAVQPRQSLVQRGGGALAGVEGIQVELLVGGMDSVAG